MPKHDIPGTGRDFYFTPAGNNKFSGSSFQNPVEDPITAIDRVNSLVIPPDDLNPASINAMQTGTSSLGIDIPEVTNCLAQFASIVTFDAIAVKCRGKQLVEWGGVISLGQGATAISLDSVIRTTVRPNTLVVGSSNPSFGNDGIGVHISGICDDIFIEIIEGVLSGDRAIMFKHEADINTPIEYRAKVIEFFGADQTLMEFNPSGTGNQAVIKASTIQRGAGATNATLFKVMAGNLSIKAEVLDADMLLEVEGGAKAGLDSDIAVGDVLIKGGAQAVLKSVGVLVGTITVETGGLLEIVCNVHVGSIVNNGTINGIINGVRYGNWLVDIEDTVTSSTYTEQVAQPNGSGGMELLPKFGGHYQYAEDIGVDTTASDVYQNKLTMVTPSLPAGDYRIQWTFETTNDKKRKPIEARIQLNSVDITDCWYSPEDPGEYLCTSSFSKTTLTSGVYTLTIDYRSSDANGNAMIRRAKMDMYRIS